MNINVSIKNFGKINDAHIKIRPFTVLAGQNSSGKSFVSKALYSFFSTINTDHVTIETIKKMDDIKLFSQYIQLSMSNPSQSVIFAVRRLQDSINTLNESIKNTFEENTFSDQLSRAFIIKEEIENVEKSIEYLVSVTKAAKYKNISDHINIIRINVSALKRIAENPTECLVSGIQEGLINSLKENFQVTSLTELKNYHFDEDISFNFDSLGSIKIKKELLTFKLNASSIDEFQKFFNVVYIESPVYWKIIDALNQARKSRRLLSLSRLKQTNYLTGVPKHFFDLIDLLQNKNISSEKLNLDEDLIGESIGGELSISDSGELFFNEKDNERIKSINLHTTALGITNLGLIALLIDRGILAKGSVLFVDEPEVHLHPSWQKVMIDTLYELSMKGINVVIASHSIDMMKCLENIMQKEDPAKIGEHFGINQLSSDGNSINFDQEGLKTISAIKDDLGESFYDMFLEGML